MNFDNLQLNDPRITDDCKQEFRLRVGRSWPTAGELEPFAAIWAMAFLFGQGQQSDVQPESVQVPQGWRMVPVKPTQEMLRAGTGYGLTINTWDAMLAAAPQPPAQPEAVQVPQGWRPTQEQFTEWCVRHDVPEHHSREAFDDAASLYLLTASPQPPAPAAPQAGEASQPMSREGMDPVEVAEAMRKRFVKLPRFSFMLGDPPSVRRVPDRYGNWLEFQTVHELFDAVHVDAALRDAGIGTGSGEGVA